MDRFDIIKRWVDETFADFEDDEIGKGDVIAMLMNNGHKLMINTPAWSTEAPTEEGWYLCKIIFGILLVRIRLSTANIWCADVHHEDGRVDVYSCALKVRDARWYGPLRPPEG